MARAAVLIGYFAIEWSEAALVVAHVHVVHKDGGAMVGRAKVHEGAHAWLWLVVEVFLVPEQPFVKEEVLALRVPISRYLQDGGGREIVLEQVGSVEVGVLGEAVQVRLVGIVAPAVAIRVDDVMPRTVEADRRTVVDVDQEGSRLHRRLAMPCER